MEKRTSWLRWLGLVVAIAIVGVLALPSLISSRWIYEPLLKRLEAGDFKLNVGFVQMRWFTPISLSEVAITESHGPKLLRIREIRTDHGLLVTLLSGRRLGRVNIIEPKIEIELLTDESNLTRLIEALEGKLGTPDSGSASRSKKPAFDLDVSVQNLTVRVRKAETNEPLVVIPPLDLDMSYRAAADGNSTLHVQPTQLLREVDVTPELMQLGLGYAIPLLAKSAWFDGRISIATGPIDILLDAPKFSTGSATITLHEVRSGPSDRVVIQVLDLVAQLRGRPSQHELVFIDGTKVEIQVADQRVAHRGLQLGLPKIDPRLQLASEGSVGLNDRALDLLVDFPVPVEFLARRETVKELGVPTIPLPIKGTLDEPRVEWSALRGEGADLLGVIRNRIADEAPGTAAVLGGLESLAEGQADEAIGAAINLLRELRKTRQARSNSDQKEKDILPDSKPEPETPPNRPILDALKKLLREGELQK